MNFHREMKIHELFRLVQPIIVHAGKGNWVFVKIDTDAGISGLGEGSWLGKARTMAAGIEDAARYLVGHSA